MLVTALGLMLAAAPLGDPVKADLNSPVYVVREKARAALRASFVPTDRTKWNGIAAMLEQAKGKSAEQVAGAVREDFGVQLEIAYLSDGVHFRRGTFSATRLDRDWVLSCTFDDDNKLVDARLLLQPPPVNPDPPPNYTGVWRVYREDGSLKSELYYMHGKLAGPLGQDEGVSGPL